jgi:uncharacterized membrane protein (UPF0127 family)
MSNPKNQISITNATREVSVCSSALLANTFPTRLFGLLGKGSLAEDAGLLIKPSSGVHTFGMAFPIDIVALDKSNRVIGVWEKTGPWKIRGLSLRTRSVLELPPGKIGRCRITVGDQLEVHSKA